MPSISLDNLESISREFSMQSANPDAMRLKQGKKLHFGYRRYVMVDTQDRSVKKAILSSSVSVQPNVCSEWGVPATSEQ